MPISFTTIGDLCADIYPQKGKTVLGGTAFNVAKAVSDRASVSIVSSVGTDEIGEKYRSAFSELKINDTFVQISQDKSSSVEITLDQKGTPHFSEWKLGVLKDFSLDQKTKDFLKTQDIVHVTCLKPITKMFEECLYSLSDPPIGGESKGSFIGKPSTSSGSRRIISADFSGDSMYSLPVSEIESYLEYLDIAFKSLKITDEKELNQLKAYAQKYNCLIVAMLGSWGAMAFLGDETFEFPITAIKTSNTTGAGDTFIGNFLINYFQTEDIQRSLKNASESVKKYLQSK